VKKQVFEHSNLGAYLKRYVDIFSVLYVPEKNWLTVREKEFFVANVILNSYGVDLLSRKASKILEDKFGFINRGLIKQLQV
jgi:hypothetical protein